MTRASLPMGGKVGLTAGFPIVAILLLLTVFGGALRAGFAVTEGMYPGPHPAIVFATSPAVCQALARRNINLAKLASGEQAAEESAGREDCLKRDALELWLERSEPKRSAQDAELVRMGIPAADVAALRALGISETRDIRLIHQSDAEYQALQAAGSFGRCSVLQVDSVVDRRGSWTLFRGSVQRAGATCPQSPLFAPFLFGLVASLVYLGMLLWLWLPARRTGTAEA